MSLIDLFERVWGGALVLKNVKSSASSDTISVDDLAKHVTSLSVALSNEVPSHVGKINSELLMSYELLSERGAPTSIVKPSLKDEDVKIVNSLVAADKALFADVIVLSDDEMEKKNSLCGVSQSYRESKHSRLDLIKTEAVADRKTSEVDIDCKYAPDPSVNILKVFQKKNAADSSHIGSERDSVPSRGKQALASLLNIKGFEWKKKDILNDSRSTQCRTDLNRSSGETVLSKRMNAIPGQSEGGMKRFHDVEKDPWEIVLKSETRHQFGGTKPLASVPKRQVVQLSLPTQSRSGYLHRMEVGVKRLKPQNLDKWYRPILEIDYFAAVGLSSATEDKNESAANLKEVPTYFQSPDQYVDIFLPLVLEEFKAQLHSAFLEMSSLEDMFCGSLSILSVERIDDFHIVRGTHDDNGSAASQNCSENDLILLTRQALKTNTSHEIHLVGKVERREKDSKRRLNILFIRFYLQNGSLRLNRARKLLAERSKWCFSRIMSITPQIREFQALSSVKYIPILPILLKPNSGSHLFRGSHECNLVKLPRPLLQILKSSFNDSQLQAISVAIGHFNSNKDFELSLIQGPPGTGKTRTIVAIVSGLLAFPLKRLNENKKQISNNLNPGSTSSTNLKSSIDPSVAIARAWQDAALARQLKNDEEDSFNAAGSFTRGRVLICAQSNAAVDELVLRISNEGLYGIDGKMYIPYLVRVGNAKTVHANSLPFFIDTLVENRLAEDEMDANGMGKDLCMDSSAALRSNLEKLVDAIRFYEAKRANLGNKNSELKCSSGDKVPRGYEDEEMSDEEIEAKLKKLYSQKNGICKDLASAQLRERKANEESRALKNKLRKSILREAEIVVTTLSGCGGDLYGVCAESLSGHKYGNSSEDSLFDAVVIDEAAQALEPATLIPLQLLRSKEARCIMVGDPKQLPATVLSSVASKYQYQCSMFERLQKAGYPVTMLTKQYRMHPEICRFPSMHFYDSNLLNGDRMSRKSATFHETRELRPYVFFDVIDGREIRGKNSGASSLYNELEADAAVEIIRFFRNRYPSEFVAGRIGIITPYKSQLSLLRSRFSSAFGPSVTSDIEFNTVDGFQGREVDIVVLSTVRAADPCSTPGINSSTIGFVADVRRMNVSLTRAKLSLWILGNVTTLQTNLDWAALVKDVKDRNLVISCKKPYGSTFKSAIPRNSGRGNFGMNTRQLHQGSRQHIKRDACKVEESQYRVHECRDKRMRSATGKDFPGDKKSGRRKPDVSPEGGIRSLVVDTVGILNNVESKKAERKARNPDSEVPEDMEKGHNLMNTCRDEELVSNECARGNVDSTAADATDICKIQRSEDRNTTSNRGLFEHGRGHRKVQVPSSSTGVDSSSGNTNASVAIPPNQTRKSGALIDKRKQRDAVDALLSSALIPSKRKPR